MQDTEEKVCGETRAHASGLPKKKNVLVKEQAKGE